MINPMFYVVLAFLLGRCYCETFYYFAYGSNLMGRRLQIRSPSAKFYDVAVLEGYRLDFNRYFETWNGAAATIVEDPNERVVGALWVLDKKDLPNLDAQELVDQGMYFAKNVTVTTLHGENITALTYPQTIDPPERSRSADLPFERRPSSTYLEVIIFGAVECNLPSDYIGFLVSFPTNGLLAVDEMRAALGYPFGPKREP